MGVVEVVGCDELAGQRQGSRVAQGGVRRGELIGWEEVEVRADRSRRGPVIRR